MADQSNPQQFDPIQSDQPIQQPVQTQQNYPQGYSQQYPLSGDYQQSPQPQQSTGGKQRIHHSYVWLGAIQVLFSIGIAALIGILPVLFEGGQISRSSEMAFLLNNRVLFLVLVIGGLLLIGGLTIGLQVLSYRNIAYEVGEKEFSYYSGIFNKKRVHVPYQRIQSVNQKATLVQRIIGVCTINIDTAGGSNNKAVVVPFLQNSEAERLRSELFTRKQIILNQQGATAKGVRDSAQGVQPGGQNATTAAGISQAATHRAAPQGALHQEQQGTQQQGVQASNVLDAPAEIWTDVRGVFGGAVYQAAAPSYEYGLSNKELIFTGLSNNTGVVLLFFAVVGSIMGFLGPLFGSSFGEHIYNSGLSFINNAFSGNMALFLVVLLIVFLLVLWLASIIGTCITYGGFKAVRRESRIEIEHGLLQHRFHGVDVDRVQSVIIKQSFIRRLIGYCELSLGKINALTENSQDQQQAATYNRGMLVHPFVKVSKVPEILAGLVPEFADVPTESIKLPSISLRRAIIRRCIVLGSGFWSAIVVAIVQLFANSFLPTNSASSLEAVGIVNTICYAVYAICILLVVVEAVNAVMWFKGSSFAYNKHFMQITNGGFSRESLSFPRKKIQYAYTKTNPFQRAAHVATIKVRTAAGVGGTTMKLLDVRENDADIWLNWLLPGQNCVQQDEIISASKNTTLPNAIQSAKLSDEQETSKAVPKNSDQVEV